MVQKSKTEEEPPRSADGRQRPSREDEGRRACKTGRSPVRSPYMCVSALRMMGCCVVLANIRGWRQVFGRCRQSGKLEFFGFKKKKKVPSEQGRAERPSKSGGGSGGVHSGLSVSARGVELGYKLDGHTNTTTHAHTPNRGDERPGKQIEQIERPSCSLLAVVVTLARAGVGAEAIQNK